ncbi:hypothetical protein E5D57_007311 [Metarhizium anisopliae]|nr:hypothetical protein E5D57_007311 [Metarhizium anisopliae]
MEKLDYFEGSEYERRTVKVQVLVKDGGEEVLGPEKSASVYVFLKPNELERGEWDFEEFRREKMKLWTRGDWAFGTFVCNRGDDIANDLDKDDDDKAAVNGVA